SEARLARALEEIEKEGMLAVVMDVAMGRVENKMTGPQACRSVGLERFHHPQLARRLSFAAAKRDFEAMAGFAEVCRKQQIEKSDKLQLLDIFVATRQAAAKYRERQARIPSATAS